VLFNSLPGIALLQHFGEDLLDGINYLEEQGIPHRDIKLNRTPGDWHSTEKHSLIHREL